MTPLITAWLFVALVCHTVAHVALVGGLAVRRSFGRATLALLMPPLAPYWGWEAGMRKRALLWLGALAAYALGIALGSLGA